MGSTMFGTSLSALSSSSYSFRPEVGSRDISSAKLAKTIPLLSSSFTRGSNFAGSKDLRSSVDSNILLFSTNPLFLTNAMPSLELNRQVPTPLRQRSGAQTRGARRAIHRCRGAARLDAARPRGRTCEAGTKRTDARIRRHRRFRLYQIQRHTSSSDTSCARSRSLRTWLCQGRVGESGPRRRESWRGNRSQSA